MRAGLAEAFGYPIGTDAEGKLAAALRTAVEKLTDEELASLDFTDVRGTQGVKEATYNVAGMDVKVAVASSLGNAGDLLKKVQSGDHRAL